MYVKYIHNGVKIPGADYTFQADSIDGVDTGIWNNRNLRKN